MSAARLRDRVARDLGLRFDDTKLAFLEEVLLRHASTADAGVDIDLRDLVEDLTVTETYFFRNPDQLEAFVHVASRKPNVRIACAGCASGEEPYTLSILARDRPELAGTQLRVRAVDLNPAMLERAAKAHYSSWSLRETPAAIRDRWFRKEGTGYSLLPRIRDVVRFERRNLADANDDLWRPESLDIVFCRNVIMYFTPEVAAQVVASIARALVPGGVLFLGHAETLRGLSHAFHLRHTHGTFYYERRGLADEQPREATSAPYEEAPPVIDDASWVETIRGASERIRALSARDPERRTEQVDGRRPSWEIAHALELLRTEQFDQARAALDALPSGAESDPDVLLLRAVILMHAGDLASAEKTASALLANDDLDAGAHYVVALCREAANDPDAAVDHDRIAAHLDPTFAMPRLHLGLIARRKGKLDDARADLERALALLEHEEPSRLLLFGGGFGREALVRLCRSEIARCDRGGEAK